MLKDLILWLRDHLFGPEPFDQDEEAHPEC